MESTCILYKNLGYKIGDAQWINETRKCNHLEINCNIREEGGICPNNLIGHACKHVVNGTDSEKLRFSETMDILQEDSSIPSTINSCSDDVIKRYEDLSKRVIKDTTAVSVSGEGKRIRIVCDGTNATEGATDFIGFNEKQDPHGYRHIEMGIVSSFFNYSDSDLFCLYRIANEILFEGKKTVKNISSVPMADYHKKRCRENFRLPIIDEALAQAELICPNANSNELYCAGVLYYYYHSKCKDTLIEAYDNMVWTDLFNGIKSPDRLIFDEAKSDINNLIKDIIKEYEKIYAGKLFMDYITISQGEKFKPWIYYGRDRILYNPNFGDVISDYYSTPMKERKKQHFELLLQKEYLKRKKHKFETNFVHGLPAVLNIINENALQDASVGSIADYSTYSVVISLVEYLISTYVFLNNLNEIYSGNVEKSAWGKAEARECIKHYYNFIDNVHGQFFDEWLCIFDKTLSISKLIRYLEENV